jgi:1-acyl-sn-glycerol-3-phosphate acyltransferase
MARPPIPTGYSWSERFVLRVLWPLVNYGRPTYCGLELLDRPGGILLAANHDSQMDPFVLAAHFAFVRFPRFMARANLWDIPVIGRLLRSMKHIPIERGAGDIGAMDAAVDALNRGELLIIFPEGTLSMGRPLPARSGVARLAVDCPEATVVLCAVKGANQYVRFPRRPTDVAVEFFLPATPPIKPGDDLRAYAASLLEEIRQKAPPVKAGRKAKD